MAITPGGRVGDASPLGKGKRKLSDYEREVAHALIRKGHSKSQAIRIARGVIQRAAATGRWGRGNAKPNVVAGAAASIAQRKAFSHAHSADGSEDIKLDWTKFDELRGAARAAKARKFKTSDVVPLNQQPLRSKLVTDLPNGIVLHSTHPALGHVRVENNGARGSGALITHVGKDGTERQTLIPDDAMRELFRWMKKQ